MAVKLHKKSILLPKKKHNLIFKKFPYDKNTFVFLKKFQKMQLIQIYSSYGK